MVGSPATGRKKEVWISTEHGTDTAPGESPNYCRDSCRRPSGASFKRCESTQAAGGPGRGFRSRSEAARRGAGGGRGGAVSSHFVSELAAAETESKTCLPRPPCGPRGARVGWALTAAEGAPLLRHGKLLLFCILRGRVVPARRPGPPDGRGAGPARVRSCLGRRAREPGAGGASPGREAHPPAGAAPTSLHLLLRRGGARGTFTAGGEGEARGRGTPCRRPHPESPAPGHSCLVEKSLRRLVGLNCGLPLHGGTRAERSTQKWRPLCPFEKGRREGVEPRIQAGKASRCLVCTSGEFSVALALPPRTKGSVFSPSVLASKNR